MARAPITWRNVNSQLRSDPLEAFNQAADSVRESIGGIQSGIQGIADREAAERGRTLESLFRERITGLNALDANAGVLRDQNALRELAGGRVAGFDGNNFLSTIRSEIENPLLKEAGILGARASAPNATQQDIAAYENFVRANSGLSNAAELNTNLFQAKDAFQDNIDNNTILSKLDSYSKAALDVNNANLSDREILDRERNAILTSNLEAEEKQRALENLNTGYQRFNQLTDEEQAAYNSSLKFLEREETIALQDIDRQINTLAPPATAEQNRQQYLSLINEFDNPKEDSTIGRLASILSEDDARDFRRKFQRAALDNPNVDPRLILSELYLGSEAYAEDAKGFWDYWDDNEVIGKDQLDAAMRDLVSNVDSQAQSYHTQYTMLKKRRDGVVRSFGDMRDDHSSTFKRNIRKARTSGADIRTATANKLNARLDEETDRVVSEQKTAIDSMYGKGTYDRWQKEERDRQKAAETTETPSVTTETAQTPQASTSASAVANLYSALTQPGGLTQAVGMPLLSNLQKTIVQPAGDFITQFARNNNQEPDLQAAENSFRQSVAQARAEGGRSLNEVVDSNALNQGFIDAQGNLTQQAIDENYPDFIPTTTQAENYMTQLKNGSVNLGNRTVSGEVQKRVHDVLKKGRKATDDFVKTELPKLPKATQDIIAELIGTFINIQNQSTQ